MLELERQNFASVLKLFKTPQLELVMAAVAAGNSPGRLWVDDPRAPQSALLWDLSYNYYLVGEADNDAFNQEASALIAEQLAPQATSRGIPIFMVHCSVTAWEGASTGIFSGLSLERFDRVFYRFERAHPPDGPEHLPPGFRVQRIGSDLIASAAFKHAEHVRSEIAQCWTSLDRFFAHGFGYCTLHEDDIVCWCTGEYFSEGKCGIGIETVEAYRGRGLATLTARAFVAHAVAAGFTPHWDSWKQNLPSVKVAEKVGFKKLLEFPVLFGRYPEGATGA